MGEMASTRGQSLDRRLPLHLPANRPKNRVTDRYVDVLNPNSFRETQQSQPAVEDTTKQPVAEPQLHEQFQDTTKQPVAEPQLDEQFLVNLDPDSLVCVLSKLTPKDLARASTASRCLHEVVEQATDARASRLGVTLAPFRGSVRLQVLHVKEDVHELFDSESEVASEVDGPARVLSDLRLGSADESFWYCEPFGVWMPASARANPGAWAAENLAGTIPPGIVPWTTS